MFNQPLLAEHTEVSDNLCISRPWVFGLSTFDSYSLEISTPTVFEAYFVLTEDIDDSWMYENEDTGEL